MSINFHAHQGRGVPFAEYEAVAAQWHGTFTGYRPEPSADRLGLSYDSEYLYVPYFGVPYRLRLSDGVLEKPMRRNAKAQPSAAAHCAIPLPSGSADKASEETVWTDALFFNETMAIYHLLHYTQDNPRITGSWVPADTLDTVASRSGRRMPDPLLAPFARQWSGRCAELDAACRRAGGLRLDTGDVSFQFAAFPCLAVRLIFWDADEDFAAQAQIQVDRCVTDFVHCETLGCITADLLDRIQEAACTPAAAPPSPL